MTTRRVYFFGEGQADGDPDRKDVLGGKGASLAAMSLAGLPIPPGFTIAAECCRLFLDTGGCWPDGLEQQVRDNLRRLEKVTGRTFGDSRTPLLVSVRSGAAVSMPGMMDTILNCGLSADMGDAQADPDAFWRVYAEFVLTLAGTAGDVPAQHFDALRSDMPGRHRQFAQACKGLYADKTGRPFPADPWEALVLCIDTVFRSWNSERAVHYRSDRGINDLAGTAVTVQAMFPSDVAGVIFTANPNDPAADEIIIESSYGLGEAIVSGEVHPDNFVVDRNDLVVKRRVIGHKTHIVAAFGADLAADPDAPSLTDEQVRRLSVIAMKTDGLYGRPMDIEWGLADGRFALLQARPIRAMASAEAREQLVQSIRRELRQLLASGCGPWVLHNLSETLPHPVPLTWSVIRRFMSGAGGFGAMYRQAGFQPSPAVCQGGFLRRIAGKTYMDVSLAPEMFSRNYPFKYDLDLLRMDPGAAQSPPTLPRGSILARLRALRKAVAARRKLEHIADHLDTDLDQRIIPEFVQWCSRQKQRDLTAMSGEQLIELWRLRERRVMDEFAPQSMLPGLVEANALAELQTFLAEHFWDEDTDELARASSVSATPDKTVLAGAELFAVTQGRGSVEQWLADHGHRGPDEFDLASPRWREHPGDVLEMVRQLEDGADPIERHRAHVEQIDARLAALSSRLPARDREQLARLVATVRRYIRFREDGKDYLMLGYDLLRDLALEAGRRLAAADGQTGGQLGDRVFFLTLEELFDALRTGAAPHDLIARRRQAHRTEAHVLAPRVIDADAIDLIGRPPKPQPGPVHAAFAVSTGLASGPARIVRSAQDAGKLGRGYVLVCPSTDPAWAPLFINAAALVLESGGALSHGAVVAREMGIPAVVLPRATAIFREGQAVTVDGHHGTVSLADRQSAAEIAPAATDQVHADPRSVPPPPGRRERACARFRNVMLLAWGVYLLAAFALPAGWVYRPSLAVLDRFLWPLVVYLGRPGAVAVIAAALAALTMAGQRLMTDNRRLREAKRRANMLQRQVALLPAESPRRVALGQQVAAVQVRAMAAALVPLAALLGPMVMIFAWLPARVAPDSWNAPPGADVSVVAMVDSGFDGEVTLTAAGPLRLDESASASRKLPPIRRTLEELLKRWHGADPGPAQRLAIEAAEEHNSPADLKAFLDAGVPPQGITWKVRSPARAAGRFAVTVAAPGAAPLSLNVVLGDGYPPSRPEARGDPSSPVRSIRIVYPPPPQNPVFWAPLATLGWSNWDAGWLITYLLAYLPAMFLLRRVMGVA